MGARDDAEVALQAIVKTLREPSRHNPKARQKGAVVERIGNRGGKGSSAKKQRVLAIGLDSAEPTVLEEYMSKGYMPTLARLRRQGSYGRLDNFDLFSAETPWTTFVTGCSPRSLGYWSPLRFAKDQYRMETRAAYEYTEVPPFFALGDDYRVAVFDVPQVRVVPNVSGVQVGAWGAHSPQVPMASSPPELYDQLVNEHGKHPGLHDDYAECLDMVAVERLRKILPVGIRRRADICVDLLRREPWDLFLTVFGEPHTIGSAVASDAFFPFADGLLAAAEAGATAVIQPGGSVRDDEVIAAADQAGLAMVFTGIRHFRH